MIVVLTGPTASGKSSLGLELAKRHNMEIVNADAFQVYEGLRIVTAAPSLEDLSSVPHHLYGHVHLNESYEISRYQKEARKVIEDILSRGATPLFIGGSGLYIRSALYDYNLGELKQKVDLAPYETFSEDDLHKVLEQLDPQEANKIHPHNRVRVLRAIEVCLGSGESKTALLARQEKKPIFETRFFSLTPERDEVYKKVNERVEKMFADGLLEEVRPLVEKYGRDVSAFRAIGVKELFPYFDGKISLEEAKESIKLATRHYVKRQNTFFTHQFDCFDVTSLQEIEDLL